MISLQATDTCNLLTINLEHPDACTRKMHKASLGVFVFSRKDLLFGF